VISRKLVITLTAITAAASLTGCATASKPESMVPATIVAATRTSTSDISVLVAGGKETSKMGASQISDDAFAQALRDSITKAALFKAVAPNGGRYKLSAFIGKVDQPTMGFSMTVKMEVSYTLVDTQSGATVWSKNIPSTYTAKAGEAFAGVTRLRLANEGAAKDNIQQAITALSALEL
jgi:hypothetical protein